jgi:hypothetical protein
MYWPHIGVAPAPAQMRSGAAGAIAWYTRSGRKLPMAVRPNTGAGKVQFSTLPSSATTRIGRKVPSLTATGKFNRQITPNTV